MTSFLQELQQRGPAYPAAPASHGSDAAQAATTTANASVVMRSGRDVEAVTPSYAWAQRRFTTPTVSGYGRDEVVRHLQSLTVGDVPRAFAAELKKRTPWMQALASLLFGDPKTELIELAMSNGDDVKRSRARVIPASLSASASSHPPDGLSVRFPTTLRASGYSLTMSQGEQTFESGDVTKPKRRMITEPLFEIDPNVYTRVAHLEPAIIGGIEKMATYASHDLLHFVFDAQWNTKANKEHDQEITHDLVGRRGFVPNVYEYFLFAMMSATFAEACRRNPALEEVVLRDAEGLVAAVESYRAKRLAAEPEAATAIASECAYLLHVGLSKNLMFIIDPGPAPGAPFDEARASQATKRFRALASAYPGLWENTQMQRAAHHPRLTWTSGWKKDQPVDLIALARTKFGASLHASHRPDARTAERLATVHPRDAMTVISDLREAKSGSARTTLAAMLKLLEGASPEKKNAPPTSSSGAWAPPVPAAALFVLTGNAWLAEERSPDGLIAGEAARKKQAGNPETFHQKADVIPTLSDKVRSALAAGQIAAAFACAMKTHPHQRLVLLEEVAAHGDAKARAEVGRMLLHGIGCKSDTRKALGHLTAAADAGELSAAMQLLTHAVEQSDEQGAKKWLQRAADLGEPEAKARLRQRQRTIAI